MLILSHFAVGKKKEGSMSMGWNDSKIHQLALMIHDGQEPEEKT